MRDAVYFLNHHIHYAQRANGSIKDFDGIGGGFVEDKREDNICRQIDNRYASFYAM